jgi:hypothetical protein
MRLNKVWAIIKALLPAASFIMLAVASMSPQTPDCRGHFASPTVVAGSNLRKTGKHAAQAATPNAAAALAAPASPARANKSQPQHTVNLSWQPSNSPRVVGYNIYRIARQGHSESREKLNLAPLRSTSCTDNVVQNGQTYFYVVKAVTSAAAESADSNRARATIQP